MQLKIFSNDKPIYIIEPLDDELKKLSEKTGVLVFKKDVNIHDVIRDLENEINTAAVIVTTDWDNDIKKLLAGFRMIDAAGGIVQNEKKEILFIFRRGKWDLPKGKKEKNETAESCAVREIAEETGVSNLTSKRKVGETRHLYFENGRDMLKLNHWFYFTSSGAQKTLPQTEEDITEVRWVSTDKIKEPMENTYSSIREIMHQFFDEP